MSSKNNSVSDLEAWFSSERMKTYSFHPDPEALYLWNTRVTKAFLEDIQHVEVLLRNHVDTAVSPKYGQRWYTHPDIPFDGEAKKSVSKAQGRASRKTQGRASINRGQELPPGRVIAELNFDFWAYLFTKKYASTIWPLVRRSLVATPASTTEKGGNVICVPSLNDFKRELDVVYKLRNRCAHHEPIIRRNRQQEDACLDRAQEAIRLLTTWIAPAAAHWIASYSRLPHLRSVRP